MKAKLTLVVLALLPGTVCAQSESFAGFNIGLGLGYTEPEITYADAVDSIRWDDGDYMLQADVAYDYAIDSAWLLGAGVSFDLADTDAGTRDECCGPVEAQLTNHYSVYLKPSFVVDSASSVFLKVAYDETKVEAVGVPTDWIDDFFHAQGIGYSLGYKRLLDQNFFFQGEIKAVSYNDKQFVDESAFRWWYKQKTLSLIVTAGYQF